jgi:hypothetical protein
LHIKEALVLVKEKYGKPLSHKQIGFLGKLCKGLPDDAIRQAINAINPTVKSPVSFINWYCVNNGLGSIDTIHDEGFIQGIIDGTK